jgi:hypothetical protein
MTIPERLKLECAKIEYPSARRVLKLIKMRKK